MTSKTYYRIGTQKWHLPAGQDHQTAERGSMFRAKCGLDVHGFQRSKKPKPQDICRRCEPLSASE